LFQGLTTLLGVAMLAIIIAQLVFLRSSIEKLTGEKPGSGPGGLPPR
jgi:hypothetical protein